MIQSSDGASVRPIQLLTKFAVSQTFCDDALSASLISETFCMVTVPKIKGNSTKCERERELQKNNVPSTLRERSRTTGGLGFALA